MAKDKTKIKLGDDEYYKIQDEKSPMEHLPNEIFYLVFERLDLVSLYRCFYVCRKFRAIVLNMRNTDEIHELWSLIFYNAYHDNDTFLQNSDKAMSYKELLQSSLLWKYSCSVSLSVCVPATDVKHMTTYRDNIIVVTKEDVTYYDMKTLEIKKKLPYQCDDFCENDKLVVKVVKLDITDIRIRMRLFGKRHPDDLRWEKALEPCLESDENAVRLYKVEEDGCFMLHSDYILYFYQWDPRRTWDRRFICRCLLSMGEILSMCAVRDELYLATSRGTIYVYSSGRHYLVKNRIQLDNYSTSFSCETAKSLQSAFVELAHQNCFVVSLPKTNEFRITRMEINNKFQYKLDCPKLTCLAQHGDILILGFSDGKVKILMPMASSREDMFRHCIHLNEFNKTPKVPVVSVKVYEESGQTNIIVATTSHVYRFEASFSGASCVWDHDHIPRRVGMWGAEWGVEARPLSPGFNLGSNPPSEVRLSGPVRRIGSGRIIVL